VSRATADIINVSDDALTIQAGISAASPGDTVFVADGTYNEAGIVVKPGILLMSASDDSTTYGGAITDPTGLNGNISMDPMYCDAVNWDLRVDAASPNLPQSPDNECGSLIGCFSQGCDSPVEATSWGSIKSLYR